MSNNSVKEGDCNHDIEIIKKILEFIETSVTTLQKLTYANVLFVYLLYNPGLMQSFPSFLNVCREKANQCFDDAETTKKNSIPKTEGGYFDQRTFDAAESLQKVIITLRHRIASL